MICAALKFKQINDISPWLDLKLLALFLSLVSHSMKYSLSTFGNASSNTTVSAGILLCSDFRHYILGRLP